MDKWYYNNKKDGVDSEAGMITFGTISAGMPALSWRHDLSDEGSGRSNDDSKSSPVEGVRKIPLPHKKLSLNAQIMERKAYRGRKAKT